MIRGSSRFAPFISLSLLSLVISGCASGRLKLGEKEDGEVIEVVGEAMIENGDVLGTKRRSLADAQKKAVEMVVGVHVSARTLVEKAVQIESNILARSDGYIKKYDILKEWQDAPLYKTRIRALVSYRSIVDQLNALGLLKSPQAGFPRIAVLLKEDAKGVEDSDMNSATNAMVQAFLDKGYRVVDRADLMAAEGDKVAREVEKGDTSRVGTLGKRLDAEILIFGSAWAEQLQLDGLGGLVSFRTTLSAQAYKAQTNEVLVTTDKSASGLEATVRAASAKSLGAAGKLAGEELAGRLADEIVRRSYVAVTVSGVASLERLKQLENVVSTVPGIGEYYLRSYGGGEARLDVKLQSVSSKDLASALERASELKAKTKSITQDAIEVAMQ